MDQKDDEFSQGWDERQEQLDARVRQLIDELAADFADLGKDLRWTLSQSLIHQAIHFASERAELDSVEFCTIATYLGEMIGHAHELMHDSEPEPLPRKFVH
jgi:hypothetical protein